MQGDAVSEYNARRIPPMTRDILRSHSHFVWSGFNAVPGLSTADYVTVSVIEKYLDFKVSCTHHHYQNHHHHYYYCCYCTTILLLLPPPPPPPPPLPLYHHHSPFSLASATLGITFLLRWLRFGEKLRSSWSKRTSGPFRRTRSVWMKLRRFSRIRLRECSPLRYGQRANVKLTALRRAQLVGAQLARVVMVPVEASIVLQELFEYWRSTFCKPKDMLTFLVW